MSWPLLSLILPPAQGLYQWVYHTHEDAQEARASQEAPGEDPGGEGTREEDQPDSGNGTGRLRDRDSGGDQALFCLHSILIPSSLS